MPSLCYRVRAGKVTHSARVANWRHRRLLLEKDLPVTAKRELRQVTSGLSTRGGFSGCVGGVGGASLRVRCPWLDWREVAGA